MSQILAKLCENVCKEVPTFQKISIKTDLKRNPRWYLLVQSQLQKHYKKVCWRCSGVFIVNFEHISHLFLKLLLLTLNKQMLTVPYQVNRD